MSILTSKLEILLLFTIKLVRVAKSVFSNLKEQLFKKKGANISKTFTVRKMSGNVGVERIFPEASPLIDKIEINKKGVVRRARIFYLRELTGKKARIKEKRF